MCVCNFKSDDSFQLIIRLICVVLCENVVYEQVYKTHSLQHTYTYEFGDGSGCYTFHVHVILLLLLLFQTNKE